MYASALDDKLTEAQRINKTPVSIYKKTFMGR